MPSPSWLSYLTTVRCPSRLTSQVKAILQNELASLRSNVCLILLSYKNYDAFNSNPWNHNIQYSHFVSLEDIQRDTRPRRRRRSHVSPRYVSV